MIARLALGLGLFLSALALHSTLAADEFPPPNFRTVAFSPDGRWLAAGCGEPADKGRVVLWEVATIHSSRPRWEHDELVGIPSISFSPDGKTLGIGTFGEDAKLLDVESGAVQATLSGHGKAARGVSFSPDGKTLAVASYEGSVKLWDVTKRTELDPFSGHGKRVFSVVWSPDGRLLVSAGEEELKLWEVRSRKEIHVWPHEDSYSRAMAFIDGPRYVATGRWDGTIRVRDVESGEPRLTFLPLGAVDGLSYCPSTHQLATCGFGRQINLWELRLEEPSAAERKRIDELLRQLDVDGYEEREAASQGFRQLGLVAEPALRSAARESTSAEVRIRARQARREMLTKPHAVLTGHEHSVEAVAFSPDGKLLASGGKDGTVRLWDVANRKELACLRASGK